jgi:hypothetical protein
VIGDPPIFKLIREAVYLALVPPDVTQDTLRHMGLYPPFGHDEASDEIPHMNQIGTTAGVIKEGKPLMCEFARYVRPALTLDVVVVLVRMLKCLGSLAFMFLCDQTHRLFLTLSPNFFECSAHERGGEAIVPNKDYPFVKEVFGESYSRAGVRKSWYYPFDEEEWIRPKSGTDKHPGKSRRALVTIVQKTCIGLGNHNVKLKIRDSSTRARVVASNRSSGTGILAQARG